MKYKKNPQDAVGDLTNISHPWMIPVGVYNAIFNQGLTKEHSAKNKNYAPFLESGNSNNNGN